MIVKATNGAEVLIDDEDFSFIKGRTITISTNGYVWVCGNTVALGKIPRSDSRGRILLAILLMQPEPGYLVDHKNGNRLDNQRSTNLRIVNHVQNSQNRCGNLGNKSSKYKGVSYRSRLANTNPWRAKINKTHIGSFKTEVEAAIAYNTKALELHGEYARLNIIEEIYNEET